MPVKLLCGGDFMPGENVHHFHRGIVTKFKGRYPELISDEVRKVIRESDYLLLNFEASLAPDEEIRNFSIARGVYVAPVEALSLLKNLEVKVIASVANNHFGQHGAESVAFSLNKLEQNGILITGKDNQPLVLEENGNRMLLWAVSLVKDKHYNGAYFKSSYERLIDELRLKDKVAGETWIISIHWGEEYYTLENSEQRALAEKLSNAGFDYIIGHHPHVIQPAATIGKTRVVYSHGNFIFDQNFAGLTQRGLMSQFDIPGLHAVYYLTRQKKFRLVYVNEISPDKLLKFCKVNFHKRKPLLMRIKMKLELLRRFYELNPSIVRTFTSRFFKL